jgi:hypothetical protein
MRLGALYDALPSITLPLSIQQRALTYVLRKALAPFLARDLAEDELALQISSGRLALSNVQLSSEVISSF